MQIDPERCDICGTCVSVCPEDAIRVREFSVTILADRCTGCGLCRTICPALAIGDDS